MAPKIRIQQWTSKITVPPWVRRIRVPQRFQKISRRRAIVYAIVAVLAPLAIWNVVGYLMGSGGGPTASIAYPQPAATASVTPQADPVTPSASPTFVLASPTASPSVPATVAGCVSTSLPAGVTVTGGAVVWTLPDTPGSGARSLGYYTRPMARV